MPVVKHKFFKVKVKNGENFTVDQEIEKTINDFLANPNHVYKNHSIVIINKDTEKYGQVKTTPSYVLLSFIYSDLNETGLNLKTTSKEIQSIVHRQIDLGEEIPEPKIETFIDKQINELNQP